MARDNEGFGTCAEYDKFCDDSIEGRGIDTKEEDTEKGYVQDKAVESEDN